MAPRETSKATPKIQRSIVKNTRVKASPATIKKTIPIKKNTEKMLQKAEPKVETRVRTNTVPKVFTPKAKENKPVLPGTATKSAKKATWKRRPKPAHSGVPVPEKMKKLLGKQLDEFDSSF
ncbi:uncharacterized protein LOC121727517 [Aricia agestis]|uniref:uncharacterized protein LOC121727517 n=1 Tax=Aricia agestis TaxID=91739 RepID=UPI001C20C000|nr:uncharacterized protein LOC121727517 [Aricia agestis]